MRLIKTKTSLKRFFPVAVLLLALVVHPGGLVAQSIESLQNEINQLNGQINQSESTLQELASREDTLKNRLALFDAEIVKIQSEINLTESKISQTQEHLRKTEEELTYYKNMLQENAKTLYKMGNPSTVEILFASDNFSEFVNKQEYLEKVKEAVNQASLKVIGLKEQLEGEMATLQQLKVEQTTQENNLYAKRQEQQNLLHQTQGEEARYQQLLAQQQSELDEANAALQAELARRSQSIGGGFDFGTGSYPWANECEPYGPPSSIDWYNCDVDPGKYWYRQCTSYAWWRRGQIGRPVGALWGNGGDWANSARAAGYEVNYTPRVGAVGVIGGYFGHVFIVEEVLNGGTAVKASQYNVPSANGGEWGRYSVVIYNDISGIQFIHDR